ncbi:hypothetical protein COOONC_03653 [Cooperia oncophora]
MWPTLEAWAYGLTEPLQQTRVFRLPHSARWIHVPTLSHIQKTCEAGLYSIVADFMHSLHSKSLEDCAFHLAGAWNRTRDVFALERRSVRYILKESYLGVVFLSHSLLPQVRALRRQPIPKRCRLSYLVPYELPPRRVGILVAVDHRPLTLLIDAFPKLNYGVRATLRRLQEISSQI